MAGLDDLLKAALWQQYGAAIDMLGNAIDACPDEVWSDRSRIRNSGIWPFTLDELDPAGVLPERPYTKEELRRAVEPDPAADGGRGSAVGGEG